MDRQEEHDMLIGIAAETKQIKGAVDKLMCAVYGNGEKGIKERLEAIESQRYTAVKLIGGVIAITNVVLAILAYMK